MSGERPNFIALRPSWLAEFDFSPINIPEIVEGAAAINNPASGNTSGGGDEHTHDGTGANSTILNGLANTEFAEAPGTRAVAGGFSAYAAGSQSVVLGAYGQSDGTDGVVIGGGTAAPLASASFADSGDGHTLVGSASYIGGPGFSSDRCTLIGSYSSIPRGASIGNIKSVLAGSASTIEVDSHRSVLLGVDGTITNGSDGAILLGYSGTVNGAAGGGVLGAYGRVTAARGFAIGSSEDSGVTKTEVLAADGFAVGTKALVDTGHTKSYAIGYAATTTAANQIRLGTATETVSIPGALAVTGTALYTGDITARDGAAGQTLIGNAGPSSEAGIKLGSAGDVAIWRASNNSIKTVASVLIGEDESIIMRDRTVGNASLIVARLTADTVDRIDFDTNGKLTWGSGSAAGDTNLYRSAADTLKTDDKIHVVGEIEIDGSLNHDGTTVGFFGVTPAVRPAAYTPTNVTTDRSYDANATTVDELADVLGTLIADLQSLGLVQ